MFFLWKLLVFQYFMTKTEQYKLCQQNTYVVRNCITDGPKMPGAVPIVLLLLQTLLGNLIFHWLPLDTSSQTVSIDIYPVLVLDTLTADTGQQPNIDMGRRRIPERVIANPISKQRHQLPMGILQICFSFHCCLRVFILCIFNSLKRVFTTSTTYFNIKASKC